MRTPCLRASRFGCTALIASAVLASGCGQIPGVHGNPSRPQPSAAPVFLDPNRVFVQTAAGPPPLLLWRRWYPGDARFALRADPHGEVTLVQWARDLLRAIGAPSCASDQASVVAWELAENTRAAWNPLATTTPAPGSTSFNDVGVQNYLSLPGGLAATVQTLRDGWTSHGYGAIVDDIRRCSRPLATALAIRASDWCSGCAAGAYVVDLITQVARSFGVKV